MRTYPDRPWIGIGVVVHKNDKILLIKRGKEPNKGQWSLPGGAQRVGEGVFECAYREVFEETGVSTHDHQFIDTVDSIHHDEDGRIKFHYTLIEVSCLFVDGGLIAADDADDAKWVPYARIKNFVEWPETLRIIEKSYLSRKASLTEE